MIIANDFPGLPYFALIPVLGVMMILAMGIGIIIGVLNVFFAMLGSFWYCFAILVLVDANYISSNNFACKYSPLMKINPMASVIEACQKILVSGVFPNWLGLIYPLSLGIVLCFIGLHLFRKHIGEMVDEL